jgi:hypothetical protein
MGGNEVRLLLLAGNYHHRLAEIGLRLARGVPQRHQHLLAAHLLIAHIVLHDRVTARIAVLGLQLLEDPLGRSSRATPNTPASWSPSSAPGRTHAPLPGGSSPPPTPPTVPSRTVPPSSSLRIPKKQRPLHAPNHTRHPDNSALSVKSQSGGWTTFTPPHHAATATQRGLFLIRRVQSSSPEEIRNLFRNVLVNMGAVWAWLVFGGDSGGGWFWAEIPLVANGQQEASMGALGFGGCARRHRR